MTDDLREREVALHGEFYASLQKVLDLDAELTSLANDIRRTGAQPLEILHRPDAVSGCKAVLDRRHHQEILAARLKQDAEPKSKTPRGETFTLKGTGRK